MGWTLRALLGGYFVATAGFLALFAVALLATGLPGLDRLPQLAVAVTLAFALIAVLPLRFGGPAVSGAVHWAVSRPLARRWVEDMQPLAFGAVSAALGAAAAVRVPGWGAALAADVQHDWATRDPGETIVLWTVLSLLGGAVGFLLVTFGAMTVGAALGLPTGPDDDVEQQRWVVLWNTLVAGLTGVATAQDVLGGALAAAGSGRWWLNLLFALMLARSLGVVLLAAGADWSGVSSAPLFASKAHQGRVHRAVALAVLVAAVAAERWLEPRLGVAAAGAAIAGVAPLVARATSRVTASPPPPPTYTPSTASPPSGSA